MIQLPLASTPPSSSRSQRDREWPRMRWSSAAWYCLELKKMTKEEYDVRLDSNKCETGTYYCGMMWSSPWSKQRLSSINERWWYIDDFSSRFNTTSSSRSAAASSVNLYSRAGGRRRWIYNAWNKSMATKIGIAQKKVRTVLQGEYVAFWVRGAANPKFNDEARTRK